MGQKKKKRGTDDHAGVARRPCGKLTEKKGPTVGGICNGGRRLRKHRRDQTSQEKRLNPEGYVCTARGRTSKGKKSAGDKNALCRRIMLRRDVMEKIGEKNCWGDGG